MIAETVGYLVAHGRRVDLRRGALLRRLPRGRGVRAGDAARGRGRAGAEAVVLCDTNGGSLPWQIEERVGAVVEAVALRRRHPRARRLRLRRRQRARRSAGGRDARAGHDQRIRRAVREREPLLDRRRRSSSRWASAASARARSRSSRTSPVRWPRSRTSRRTRTPRTSGGARSRTRAACTSRRSAGIRAPTSTSTRRSSAIETRVVVSELSGRGNVLAKAEEYDVDARGGRRVAVLRGVKELEARGYAFEAAEASVALLMRRAGSGVSCPRSSSSTTRSSSGSAAAEEASSPTRPSRCACAERVVHTAAEGNGPVERARRGAPQGAVGGVPGGQRHPARGLQGPHPRRRRGHGATRPRAHRARATAKSAGPRSARRRTCSRPLARARRTEIEYGLSARSGGARPRARPEKGAA